MVHPIAAAGPVGALAATVLSLSLSLSMYMYIIYVYIYTVYIYTVHSIQLHLPACDPERYLHQQKLVGQALLGSSYT